MPNNSDDGNSDFAIFFYMGVALLVFIYILDFIFF